MKRAINSVGLNAGEGISARTGNRTVRLESAMASERAAGLAPAAYVAGSTAGRFRA